jgi:hypothetical protein
MKPGTRPGVFTIMHNVVIWRCPFCMTDQWAQWERRSRSEKRVALIERILNHPICVGCENLISRIGVN